MYVGDVDFVCVWWKLKRESLWIWSLYACMSVWDFWVLCTQLGERDRAELLYWFQLSGIFYRFFFFFGDKSVEFDVGIAIFLFFEIRN